MILLIYSLDYHKLACTYELHGSDLRRDGHEWRPSVGMRYARNDGSSDIHDQPKDFIRIAFRDFDYR
jgi:hypothetical protein